MSQEPTIIYWQFNPYREAEMDYKMPVNHGESKSGTPQQTSGTISTAPTETEPLTKCSSNASSSSSSSSLPSLSTAWVTAQYLEPYRRHHLPKLCRSLKCWLIKIPTSGTQETCETPVESRPSKRLMKTGTQKSSAKEYTSKEPQAKFSWQGPEHIAPPKCNTDSPKSTVVHNRKTRHQGTKIKPPWESKQKWNEKVHCQKNRQKNHANGKQTNQSRTGIKRQSLIMPQTCMEWMGKTRDTLLQWSIINSN